MPGEPLVQHVELLAHVERGAVRLERAVEHGAVELLGGLLRQVAEAGALARARACPTSGVYSPSRTLSRVVLPAPFGPTSATRSPGREHPVEVVEQDARARSRSECRGVGSWCPDFCVGPGPCGGLGHDLSVCSAGAPVRLRTSNCRFHRADKHLWRFVKLGFYTRSVSPRRVQRFRWFHGERVSTLGNDDAFPKVCGVGGSRHASGGRSQARWNSNCRSAGRATT